MNDDDRHGRLGGAYADDVPALLGSVSESLSTVTSALVGGEDTAALLELVTDGCVRVLGATAAGIMVPGSGGEARVLAASDDNVRHIELLQAQAEHGPCLDAIRTGEILSVVDLRTHEPLEWWPVFTPAALTAGYRAVLAVPMRLDGEPVGGLNLLFDAATDSFASWYELVQVFADLATVGLSAEAQVRRSERWVEATLSLLNDRVHLGQAVGMVAGVLQIGTDQAHALIVAYTRAHGLQAGDVVRAITDRSLAPAALSDSGARHAS